MTPLGTGHNWLLMMLMVNHGSLPCLSRCNAHRHILLMEKSYLIKGWPYVQGLQPSTTEQTGPYYHRVVQ